VFAATDTGIAIYGESAPVPPVIEAVANAASYSTAAISPGSLISIFGSNLAGITAGAPSVPLPMSLADTSVTVSGVPAPLLYESPGQINVQIPWEVPAGPATIVVRTRGSSSAAVNLTIQPVAPGLFTDQNGGAAGNVVSIFFTGLGPVTPAVDDGAAPASGTIVPATLAASATIGGTAAQIEFVGLAPLYPGVAQMNLKVPALPSGVYPLIVSIGGQTSNAAQLVISGL
jgi:uncharacterized protein (TIGR03437 family)